MAQVNITEIAVKWARYWFPEMGESEIQRVYGNRHVRAQPSPEWEARSKLGKSRAAGQSTSAAPEETSESKQKESETETEKVQEDDIEFDSEEAQKEEGKETSEQEKETTDETKEEGEGDSVQKDPAAELKERLAKARLAKAEKKAMERKQRIKAILEKNRNKNKDKVE